MSEREAFEAWVAEAGYYTTKSKWEAWQAATARERERCAKVCLLEQVGHSTPAISDDEAYNTACIHCSEAILLLDMPEGK